MIDYFLPNPDNGFVPGICRVFTIKMVRILLGEGKFYAVWFEWKSHLDVINIRGRLKTQFRFGKNDIRARARIYRVRAVKNGLKKTQLDLKTLMTRAFSRLFRWRRKHVKVASHKYKYHRRSTRTGARFTRGVSKCRDYAQRERTQETISKTVVRRYAGKTQELWPKQSRNGRTFTVFRSITKWLFSGSGVKKNRQL